MKPIRRKPDNERDENCSGGSRVIQIHPTLQCNLTCKHCYSSSLPSYKTALELSDLKRFLGRAYEEGFNAVSISGGEPFLYADLAELLEFTKETGFTNAMVTNGMLLNTRRAGEVLDLVDLIAVSVDGKPELHNKIRNYDKAYPKMLEGLEVLKSRNMAFGLLHTITNQSWDSLLWLGELAADHGAKLLQLHPLEMYGRAREEMSGYHLGQETLHKIFILVSYLRDKYEPELSIQLDMLHRDYLKVLPESVNAFPRARGGRLSDIIDSIVVDSDGNVLPFGYGLSEKYQIGNIKEPGDHKDLFAGFISTKLKDLLRLFEHTYNGIIRDEENDLVNWNELVISGSNMKAAGAI